MPTKSIPLGAALVLLSCSVFAQDKSPARFGKISPDDFKQTRYDLDTGASAVVMADIGSTAFDSGSEWFVQVYKRYKRIKILNKNGYDMADEEIYLHQEGSKEELLQNLKAVTYNLENGKVVETKLESKAVFTEKADKNTIIKKFTLPNVKEGSIIEISYTINSEFPYYLRSWAFQGQHPVLWSEYEVELPEYYEYIFLSQGYNPFHIKDSENSRKTYNLRVRSQSGYGSSGVNTEAVSVSPGITRHRWVMKDVAPLKEEGYVTTLRNHISSIEFQLAAVRYPNSPVQPVMSTWPKFMEEMMKDEEYAGPLTHNNGFLQNTVEELTKDASSPMEKAQRIYYFVRDNYTCTDLSVMYAKQSLKTTFNKKSGNVAEINILLVAMLRSAGLNAAPVLLSTRDHGKVYALYPIRTRFNYTVANVRIGEDYYQMDATRPYLGFGRLHSDCYNGHARIVNAEAEPLEFEPDSLREMEVTGVFISPDDKGKLKGHFQQQATYFNSYSLREKVREKGQDAYFKEVEKGFHAPVKLSNGKIDSLDRHSFPAVVQYDFNLDLEDENGMIYLNPMFSEAVRSNPFKSADRRYPVEMPAVPDVSYTLSMQLPENYTVEDMPKSTIVKFNDGEGIFQFLTGQQGNLIQMRSRLKLSRATYSPDEYESLRNFFDIVVKKHAEQIVLKKKS